MASTNTTFGDKIFTAADLNRRAGHVLDEARTRPVTITRNEEAFALLLRKDASRMVETASNATQMVDLATAIATYRQVGEAVPVGHAFQWLNAFDTVELRGLLNEAHDAFHRALHAEISWDEFEAVFHEWHESAMAVRSQTLAAAFGAPASEVPLERPVVVTADCSTDV
jgi:prevent-host-death family protein